MIIQNNFSDTHLLFSQPVNFSIFNDEGIVLLAKFQVNLPTVSDLYFNDDVAFCLSLLKQTLQELASSLKVLGLMNSHLELMRSIMILGASAPGVAVTWDKIFNGLKYLCPDIVAKNGSLFIQGAEVNDELFENMRNIWLIASGNKVYSKAYIYMTAEQRAYEEKIQAIKNKGKNAKSNGTNFEKIYMILTYEFGYTREEILKMTMHAVNTIVKYTSKSINYKLTLAAKAYGNTKKVQFITDQGE